MIYQPYMGKTVSLDEWVREIISWHFNSETGSPFWFKRKEMLNFDPMTDIRGYNDLEKFGFFNEDDLKKTPINESIPNGYSNKNNPLCRVFETGGTLGLPKRIIDCEYRNELASWLSYSLDMHDFPKGGNWLHLGPSGPHVIGHTTSKLAHIRGGLCHYIDIDTRWIKLCLKKGYTQILEEYLDHVLSQAVAILNTQDISFIFTTPQLLQRLCEKISPKEKCSLKGIVCGGTHVTPEFHRLLRKEIVSGIPLCLVYGNTIMGVAPQEPFKKENGWDVKYYGLFPYFTIRVVDPDASWKEMGYGETGRIMITVLTRDYFIPNLLERDEGIRISGNDFYAWDGVANVKPYKKLEDEIIEGVY